MITEEQIIQKLKEIMDPDIPCNIWDLGLIYSIGLNAEKNELKIIMTLTSQESQKERDLPTQVTSRIHAAFPEIGFTLEMTFDPTWTPERLTDAGKRRLGIDD